jgi:uncharacterized protein (TIGR01777 family)
MPRTFVVRAHLPVSAAEAFAWHERPGAFQRLNPPWEPVTVLEQGGGIRDGGRVLIRIPFGPFGMRAEYIHQNYHHGRQFEDVQRSGPFSNWRHTHRFIDEGNSASTLEDDIEYSLPAGPLGALLAGNFIEAKLRALFAYRHEVLSGDLEVSKLYPSAALTIAISGSSGLIGSQLASFLSVLGHRVKQLVRHTPRSENEIQWDPARGVANPERLESLDCVVHLAGESIASGRWSAARKQRIWNSRVEGTAHLAKALAALRFPPKTFISASAVGFFGNRGDEVVTEASPAGRGFLAELVQGWERATEPASASGIRVVHARFGVVLSPFGGALAKMLPPFRLGVGGPLGSGKQYMSWIELNDAVRMLYACMREDSIAGPVNFVSPDAVTNRDFSTSLARILRRPCPFPVPAPILKVALGEMADEALLSSCRAASEKLPLMKAPLRCAALERALRVQLGKLG